MKEELFALIDCNNFYVSCERVFQPWLNDKPVVVLSNNDGCIISRSEQAKALGIKMGVPVFKCRDILDQHNVTMFSSNFSLYGDMSHRVMQALQQFSPHVEIYSIDEAFISLKGVVNLNYATQYALHIKEMIYKWTGIPVSIGLGRTKTLAKVANKISKKQIHYNGVVNLKEEDTDQLLKKVDVSDIWGIGRKHSQLLRSYSIYNAYDLKEAPHGWIRHMLKVGCSKIQMELQGTSCMSLSEISSPKKGITCSRSFGKSVETLEELQEAVASYTARAAEKLRAQESVATLMYVCIRTSFHKTNRYSRSQPIVLSQATSFTPDLIQSSHKALKQAFKTGFKYKKAGVVLTGIIPKDQAQLSLFKGNSSDKVAQFKLMEALDGINKKWGKNSLQFGSQGMEKSWKMKQDNRSPQYTTQWTDLLTVT